VQPLRGKELARESFPPKARPDFGATLKARTSSSGEHVEQLTSTTQATRGRIEADIVRESGRETRVLDAQWATLSRALGHYERKVADEFSAAAYDSVEAGVIRFEQRRRLAQHAEELGIRPFDAQLLIACALRQWVLHHGYDPTPSRDAPALSFEHKAWRHAWTRTAFIAATFLCLEAFIVWKWLIET
jgi:hypothetical protein